MNACQVYKSYLNIGNTQPLDLPTLLTLKFSRDLRAVLQKPWWERTVT